MLLDRRTAGSKGFWNGQSVAHQLLVVFWLSRREFLRRAEAPVGASIMPFEGGLGQQGGLLLRGQVVTRHLACWVAEGFHSGLSQ